MLRPLASIGSRLPASRRGLITIISGTALGQLFGLLAAPVLTRIYSPSDFGMFTVVFAMAATIGTVAGGRYELAIPLPKGASDSYSLVFLGLTCCALTASLGTLVVALAGDILAVSFSQRGLKPWLWFVFPLAAFMGATQVLNQLAIRRMRYGAIGRRNVVHAAGTTLTQIALGLAQFTPGGMFVGMATGQLIGATSLAFGSGLRGADAKEGYALRKTRDVARRYWRFPVVMGPSGLLNVLGVQLPVVLLAYFYGTSVAGWMGLTQRVLAVPVALVGTAIAQVYLSQLAVHKRVDPASVASLFSRASRRLLAIGASVGLVFMVAGPHIFALVFGQEWEISGYYAQAMALGVAAQFVGTPLSQTLIVYERLGLQLLWDSSRLLLVSTAIIACAAIGASALTAIWVLSLASAVSYLASWLMSWGVVRTLRTRPGRSHSTHGAPT